MARTRAKDGDNVIIRENRLQQSAVVSIALFLLVQTLGWVWWASSTSTTLAFLKDELKNVKQTLTETDADRYKASEAAKDFAVRDAKITELGIQVDFLRKNPIKDR